MATAWSLSGEQVGNCTCKVSPCPCTTAGGDPTEGDCKFITAFQIKQGKYGDVDLSGLYVGLLGTWPGNVLKGNWSVGLIIDEKANDKQANAIQEILSGKAGGVFAQFVPLISKFIGVEKGKFSFQMGAGNESGTVTVGNCDLRYEALKGPGGRTELHHGALAFRDRIFPGKANGGRLDALGIKGAMDYGEWSDFEFTGP